MGFTRIASNAHNMHNFAAILKITTILAVNFKETGGLHRYYFCKHSNRHFWGQCVRQIV